MWLRYDAEQRFQYTTVRVLANVHFEKDRVPGALNVRCCEWVSSEILRWVWRVYSAQALDAVVLSWIWKECYTDAMDAVKTSPCDAVRWVWRAP